MIHSGVIWLKKEWMKFNLTRITYPRVSTSFINEETVLKDGDEENTFGGK